MNKEFEHDPDLHCAVLHGLGGNFCSGYDLEVRGSSMPAMFIINMNFSFSRSSVNLIILVTWRTRWQRF